MSAAASENLGLWQPAECLKSVFEEIKVILESGGQVHELTVENIQELMITQIKISEILAVGDSVKYSSVYTFMKFLALNAKFPISQLDIVLLLSFRTALKLHKGHQEVNKLHLDTLMLACGVHPHSPSSYNIETNFLIDIGFELTVDTPYDFLAESQKQLGLSPQFMLAAKSYIDFCITIKYLATYPPELLYAACLIACYRTFDSKPPLLASAIYSLQNIYPTSSTVAAQILCKLQQILGGMEEAGDAQFISI